MNRQRMTRFTHPVLWIAYLAGALVRVVVEVLPHFLFALLLFDVLPVLDWRALAWFVAFIVAIVLRDSVKRA